MRERETKKEETEGKKDGNKKEIKWKEEYQTIKNGESEREIIN